MSQQDKRYRLGAILILIGAIFLLGNLGLIPWEIRHYLFTWKGILILIGTLLLITKKDKTPGIVLVSIGSLFLIPEVLGIPGFSISTLWPLILIAIGLLFIFRQRGIDTLGDKSESDADMLDDVNIFGGGDVVVTSNNFKGGKVTSVFGGGNYNLSQSKLAEPPVIIDVFSAFGGNTFMVPNDWNVKVEVTSILGGFSDNRTATPHTGDRELIIKGLVLFGGGEVKGY